MKQKRQCSAKARGRLRRTRRDPVVGGTAELTDRPERIQAAQLVAVNAFEIGRGILPGLDPSPAQGDLFCRPASQHRGIRRHALIAARDEARTVNPAGQTPRQQEP